MYKLNFLILFIFLVSCSKEDTNSLNLDNKTELRDRSERIIKQYNSPDSILHSSVAKTLSVFFKHTEVRTAFDLFTKDKESNVVLLADFLYNKVLNDSILYSKYPVNATNHNNNVIPIISLCDLINDYLQSYPGLEISFQKETEDDFPDIIGEDDFETVSVYTDIDNYPIYKNGIKIGYYSVSDTPTDKTILKLQTFDVYDVLNVSSVNSSSAINKYGDLMNSCELLRLMIYNAPIITNVSLSKFGCVYTNPLGNSKIRRNL